MATNNWFNAAGSTINPSQSTSSPFTPNRPSSAPAQAQAQTSGFNNSTFGGGAAGSPFTPAQGGIGGAFTSGGGQMGKSQFTPNELEESKNASARFLESYKGGNKKKSAVKPSSPTGPSSFTEPSRFGSNSLYGSGSGISPSRTPHRLSRQSTSNSRNSPLTTSRSRMSTGGSAGGYGDAMDEDRPPSASREDEGYGSGGLGGGEGTGYENQDYNDFRPATPQPSSSYLMIYGLSTTKLDRLKQFLSNYGTLSHFVPGPAESNYALAAFDDPNIAPRLIRQTGELRLDGWYLGFREAGSEFGKPGNRSAGGGIEGLPMSSGGGGAAQQMITTNNPSGNNGQTSGNSSNNHLGFATLTPNRNSGTSIFKPAPAPAASSAPVPGEYAFGTTNANANANGQPGTPGSGMFGRVAEVLFGR